LNAEQYRLLCEACDRILLAPDTTPERIAISWLHVIREHPEFLPAYDVVFSNDVNYWLTGRVWLRSTLSSCKFFINKIAGALQSPESGMTQSNADVLIISHLINKDHVGESQDFYFGELIDALQGCGFTVAIGLINHVGFKGNVNPGYSPSNPPRILLSGSLSLREEFLLLMGIIAEARRLKKRIALEADPLGRRCLKQAARVAHQALTNLHLAKEIGQLVKQVQPKAIVTTFEGYAWERMTYAATREYNPKIKCIGYHHSVLLRLQHAIRRPLQLKFNPDWILTSGDQACEELTKTWEKSGTIVKVLGTKRVFKGNSGDAPTGKAVLVLPEGIVSECLYMFRIVVDIASELPHQQFILRLHPLISRKKLEHLEPRLSNFRLNVRWSTNSMEQDIKASNRVCYRGTSAVFEAIGGGCQPIYLERPGEMTIDPLYCLGGLRKSATDKIGLMRILREPVSDSEYIIHATRKIFAPLKPEVLIDAIKARPQ